MARVIVETRAIVILIAAKDLLLASLQQSAATPDPSLRQ